MPPAVVDAPADPVRAATPPTGRGADAERRPPTALDRFLWTIVKDADEDAILNYWLTREEGARLHALERKSEAGGGLSHAETMERFDLNVLRQVVPLLKAAVEQKRAGWTGETAIWGEK